MSEPVARTHDINMHESAFGRPASWWAAWPAVAAGSIAFLLAVYGTFLLPRQLPSQYTHALEQTQQRYRQLTEKASGGASERLIDMAGDMDVIYSRLVGLEGNSPERYWQWAEFQQAHAERVQDILQDPTLSLNPAARQRWSEQAEHFRAKSHEILDQLALRPSELQAQSIVHVAERKYRTGLAEFGVREASGLAASLADVLAVGDSDSDSQAALTPPELQAAQLLLIQLHIEAAWQLRADSSLTYDPERLETAWELLAEFDAQRTHAADDLQWQATRGLLAAMTGREGNEAALEGAQDANSVAKAQGPGESQRIWNDELAQLQLAAIDNDWAAVASQLSLRSGRLEPEVTSGLVRTVCRLAVSPLAGSAEQADVGMLLAAQIAPHLPETAELFWECARLQAGQVSQHVRVPESLPQAIMAGQSGWLKHSLAALSATLEDKNDVARNHVQLLGRAQGNASLVARVALWRAQVLAVTQTISEAAASANRDASAPDQPEHVESERELARLTELLSSVVQIEPKSGLNWFVLGTLQFRAGNLDAMRTSLAEAKGLLGEVPAIEQMLDAANQ